MRKCDLAFGGIKIWRLSIDGTLVVVEETYAPRHKVLFTQAALLDVGRFNDNDEAALFRWLSKLYFDMGLKLTDVESGATIAPPDIGYIAASEPSEAYKLYMIPWRAPVTKAGVHASLGIDDDD